MESNKQPWFKKKSSVIKLVLILFLGVGILSCTKIPSIADFFYWHANVFFKNDCSYSKIRVFNSKLDPDEIKGYLPEGSTIFLKFKSNNEYFVDVRHLLYPIKVESFDSSVAVIRTPYTYLIDFTDSLYQNHPFVLLKTGQRLIDTSNSGFLQNKIINSSSLDLTRILSFILISILYILNGCLLIHLLKFKAVGSLHLLTTGYIAGLLLNNIILGLGIIAGFMLSQYLVIITYCSIALILMSLLRFKLKNSFFIHKPVGIENNAYNKLSKVFFAFIFFIILIIICINLIRPVDFGDAVTFWMLKSKIIFHEKSFIFHEILKNDYPILIPLSVAANYAILNGVSDEIAMWGVNIIFICLISQIYSAVLILTKEKIIALLAIITFILFYFYPSINSTPTGDQILMVFFTISAVNALLYITTRNNHYLYLSFFFAIGLTQSKQEGFIYSIIIGFLISFFTFSYHKKAKPIIIFISFALLYLLNWGWTYYLKQKGYYHTSFDFTGEPVSLYKIYMLVKTQVYNITVSDFQKGIMIGIIFTFALIAKKLKLVEVQFLFFIIFLSFFFAFFSILPWSLSNITNYSWTAVPRLSTQLTPFMVILLFVLSKDHILQLISSKHTL